MRRPTQQTHRRHDELLRRYLVVTRDRAEAQLAGSSRRRIERLAVRERALAGALRRLRLRLGVPETFDPELESARLGIDGKRPVGATQRQTGSMDPKEHSLRPRITPVPSSSPTLRTDAEHRQHADAPRVVTASDLLEFIEAHEVEPDAVIVVRRLPAGPENVDGDRANVTAISLTHDGRMQLDIH